MTNAIKTNDLVNIWSGNLRNAETNFFATVLWSVEQAQGGNFNALAKLLCITHGKECKKVKLLQSETDKGIANERTKFAEPLKRILSYVLVNYTYKFDKEKDYGVVFIRNGNYGFDAERVEALRMLGKKTLKDKSFGQAFPKVDKEKKARDAESVAKSVAKALRDNGLTMADIMDLVRAELSA